MPGYLVVHEPRGDGRGAGNGRVTGADILSIIRIATACIIAGAAMTFFTSWTAAAMLFMFFFGVATDFGGEILRRRGERHYTRTLDSFADKALVFGVLIPIGLRGFPPLIALLPLLARDAVALALQILAAQRHAELPVGTVGRLKTGFLYVACAALLILAWLQSGPVPMVDPGDLGTILLYLGLSTLAIVTGTVLSFVTLVRYVAALRSSEAA